MVQNLRSLTMATLNVNTLDKSHHLYDDLTDLISVHNLHQFVNQPTYHKPNTAPSLLDHIYSNDLDLITQIDYVSAVCACYHTHMLHCWLSFLQAKPALVCRIIWQYKMAY